MPSPSIREGPPPGGRGLSLPSKAPLATTFAKVWQLPFVDVFKQAGVLAGTTGEMKGDVKSRLDRDIGKKVFQLRGAVSAANTLDIPSSRPDAKPLGLTGKFVYVQCRAVPTRPFCFHIDLLTTTNFGLRVSLSNIYKKVKTTGRTVQIPCFLDKGQRTKGKFTVVCLHLPSLIHDHFPPSHQYKCVKSFRLCSNLDVRGIFTSDTRYTLLDMPREMTFPVPRNQTWNARYVWMEMQPYPELGRVAIEQAAEDQDEPSAESSPVIVRHARLGGEGDAEGMDAMSVGAGDDAGEEKLGSREALTPGRGTGVRGSKVRHTSGRKVARSSPEREEPLMYLQSVLGYTMSMGMQHLCWLPDDKHIVYSNNNVVVLLDVQSGQQQFLFGHTGVVTAAVCSHLKDRPLLATVQEGPTPTVCLWDLAAWMGAHSKEAQQDPLETHSAAVEVPLLCTLSADFVSVCSLAFSSEHALRKGKLLLAVAGRDFRQRSLIVLWDLTQMDAVVPPTVHARQTSEFHVQRLLFSPYTSDPFNLVSCGNQSIRFWRIKNRCLPAHSLVLREYSKTCFTDLGFEPVYGVGDSQSKRIFVATKDGSVFQVNYEERVLECIYQLHDAPITSLAVNEGFCVTGSEDCYLRVWPLDFTDYYLQAKHKGAISCVQVSCDGLQIVAGTANGTVGVLDVASTVYRTRIRSHANGHAINAVAMDPQRAEFVTVSTDGTIRVWNLDSMEQVYEFFSKDAPLSVAYHPDSSEYKIAVGFASGSMRVMDIPSVTMHIDYHQHKGAVVDVLFDSDGKWLYTAGLDGNICQYAVGNDYQPFKMFASYRMPPASPVSRATLCRACSSHLKKRSAPALTSPNSSGSFTSFVTASPASPNSPYPGQLDHDKLPSPGASPDSNNADDSDVSTRAHTCAKYSLDPLYPHCLAVSDDGSLIATLGLDPLTVLLVDTKTMGEVQRVTSTQGPVAKFYFSLARPTTEILLVLRDSSFQRRCLQTGQLVGGSIVRQPKHMLSKHKPSFDLQERPSESQNSECTAAALSPKGRFVVTAKSDGRVQVWEYFSEPDADLGQTSSQTYKLHYDISKRLSSEAGQLTGLNASVSHMCFSRKADRLITVGGDSVFVWSFHGLDNVPSQWEQATDKYGRQRDLDDKDEYAERQRDHFGPSEWHQGGGACRHHLHEPTRHPLHYYGDADSIASSPYPSVYASSDITSSSELDTPNRTSRDIDTPSLLLSPSPVRIEAHSRFFAPTPQNLPPRLEDNANINLHGMDVEDVEDVENVEEEDIGVDEDAIMTLD